MEIVNFIGQKLNFINAILRYQIEIDRYLKLFDKDIRLTYEYYIHSNNPIEFFSNRYLLYPWKCFKYSKRNKEDTLYHIVYQHIGDLAFFLNKNKTFITVYDVSNFLHKGNIKNPSIVRNYAMLGIKRCRNIIAISEFTKNELITKLNIPEEKIVVIKCGIDHKIFYPLSQNELSKITPLFPNKKILLNVGTESPRKNIKTLLRAFYLVKKKYRNIKLIRVGPSRNFQLIKKLGLENDVIYMKNIDNRKVVELYNSSDFLITPSLYEGFGLPGLEAAACRTPVICSDIPVFREIYKDFPLYFSPLDHKMLARLIIENIENEEVRQKMIEKGEVIAKSYTWEAAANKYLNLVNYINNH